MAETYYISDLHLGHAGVCAFAGQFRGNCTTVEEHDAWIVEQWNSVVKKADLVYVLGDVAWNLKAMESLNKMRGQKILVRGNHDKNNVRHMLTYFQDVCGFLKKDEFWLSHCPIHPEELRGRRNIHGHVHLNVLNDPRYISVCVESCRGRPVHHDAIFSGYYTGALPL